MRHSRPLLICYVMYCFWSTRHATALKRKLFNQNLATRRLSQHPSLGTPEEPPVPPAARASVTCLCSAHQPGLVCWAHTWKLVPQCAENTVLLLPQLTCIYSLGGYRFTCPSPTNSNIREDTGLPVHLPPVHVYIPWEDTGLPVHLPPIRTTGRIQVYLSISQQIEQRGRIQAYLSISTVAP